MINSQAIIVTRISPFSAVYLLIVMCVLSSCGKSVSSQVRVIAGKPDTTPAPPVEPATTNVDAAPAAYEPTIPDTTITFRMIPVPGNGDGGDIKPIFLAATEVTWDMYDLFVYGETTAAIGSAKGADAVTRPSKPYLPPDRGFGHAGYPAMSMSHYAATQFCEWLSKKTGHNYRLPTEAEWAHACAQNRLDTVPLDEIAWHFGNAQDKTHPVGTKMAGALWLHDMLGNVAEWVTTAEGRPMTCGGSYLDEGVELTCDKRTPPSANWNASDPQLPKSRWWLADCGFVGFRVVREMD